MKHRAVDKFWQFLFRAHREMYRCTDEAPYALQIDPSKPNVLKRTFSYIHAVP